VSTQDTCCLALGELLVLFTDGVTEARALGGEFFGEAPLRRLLTAYVDAPPRFLCELIEREVNAFQGGERSDDLTLLMLRRNS
jgi:sigma-B regulation protein RsbU (phosphoserine phosphatase)